MPAAAPPRCPRCRRVSESRICSACGTPRFAGPFAIARVVRERLPVRVLEAFGPDDRPTTLYELTPGGPLTTEEREAFHATAERLRSVAHPQVPAWGAPFEVPDGDAIRLYLPQDRVPGPTLAELRRQRRFSEREALTIGRELLEVLVALHGALPRVVHGDVGLDQVVRAGDGRMLLVGCGLQLGPGKRLGEAAADVRGVGEVLDALVPEGRRSPDFQAIVQRLREDGADRPFRGAAEARAALRRIEQAPGKPSRLRRVAELLLAIGLVVARQGRSLRFVALVILGLMPGYLAGAGFFSSAEAPKPPRAARPPSTIRPRGPPVPENPWEAGGLRALAKPWPTTAVTVVLWTSPRCEACDAAVAVLEAMRDERPETVTLLHWRSFSDGETRLLAQAERAAEAQGRRAAFLGWARAQPRLSISEALAWAAAEPALDAAAFARALSDRRLTARLEAEAAAGGHADLEAPTVFVNGRLLPPPLDDESLRAALGAALATAGR